MTLWQRTVLTVAFFTGLSCAQAATPVNLDINISGTVVVNGSCIFNKGEVATVDFGDIDISIINGNPTLSSNYRKPVSSMMTCTGDSSGNTQMTFKSVAGGTLDYQGQKLLPVSINGASPGQQLAVRLLVNGVEQDVDAAFSVDMLSQPDLQVELVQVGDGSGLTSGALISSSATLVMEFL
ncbi:fimbrial protein [Huaxiibacter chinensis]